MRYVTVMILTAIVSAAAVRAGGIMVLDPSRVSQPSGQDPNSAFGEPNVPVNVLAEGVIGMEAAAPAVSVMTAATEAPAFKYRLTYRANELIDESSWTYYQLFLAVDPNHPEREPDAAFLREQAALEPKAMNLEALAAHLEACKEKLAQLEEAARCRTVVWPKIQPPRQTHSTYWRGSVRTYEIETHIPEHLIIKIADVPALLKQLDAAGLLLAAKARYHIARGEYEAACRWLRAGLAFARQMTWDADAMLAMTGAVNAGRTLGQVETWVQQPQAPSLFRTLGDLPRPLIRLLNVTANESCTERGSFDVLEVEPEFLKQSPRVVQNIERLVAALQCVEAVRLHAAIYEGRLPETLAEITDVRVPLDPVTRLPFVYERREDLFILSSETDSVRRVEIRYRIIRRPHSESYGMPEYPGMSMF